MAALLLDGGLVASERGIASGLVARTSGGSLSSIFSGANTSSTLSNITSILRAGLSTTSGLIEMAGGAILVVAMLLKKGKG